MAQLYAQSSGRNRFVLGNEFLRLDFDTRTSDTMYNYIWVRNAATGEFERLYNFGCDVSAIERGKGGLVNTIGVNLAFETSVNDQEAVVKVIYPAPLVIYRQLEKAADLAAIWNYPSLPVPLPPQMRVADASLAVFYRLRRGEPAFETWAQMLGGCIERAVPIFNAMWVDNPNVPATMFIENVGEFDWNRPAVISQLNACDVRYLLFYNRDGSGTPYGLVIQGRQKTCIGPHAGNPDGEGVFKMCSTNQEFKPRKAPTERYNDTNVYLTLGESRISPPVRWVVYPELANGRGLSGAALLAGLQKNTEEGQANWWRGATLQPSVELTLRTWPMRQPPSTLWR